MAILIIRDIQVISNGCKKHTLKKKPEESKRQHVFEIPLVSEIVKECCVGGSH